MSAIDDARYICQEIGSVRDAITDMTTMLVSALTNQDLAAQLKALEERFKVLSDCYESHLVALHPAKQSIRFGPVLNDAKPAVDEEMVEPPEFHDFCERIFIPGTDYRTGDIRMLLREHIKELREIVQRLDAGV